MSFLSSIVHTLEDCLAVFFTSGLDVLVVGEEILEKRRLGDSVPDERTLPQPLSNDPEGAAGVTRVVA